ncbi:MAG: MFS transporter [Pseudobdellovibrionaceae bacterium]
MMVGVGETYLPAYALSIGMGDIFAGLLTTLPLVSGAFLQLFAPAFLHKISTYKKWVVLSTFLQAITFIPLVYYTFQNAVDFWTLFLVLTLYWASGFAASPAWNYWMGRLIEVEKSQAYFAMRASVSQVGILLGLILGGVALHNKVELGPVTSVFSLLFVFAFLCRLLSTWLLSKQHFSMQWQTPQPLKFYQSWQIFWQNQEKRQFFLKLIPFQIAVFTTGPFVGPFMLSQLKLSYSQFMISIAMLFLGKMITLRILQNKNTSGLKLFLLGAALISVLPLGWLFSSHYYWVVFLQFISGLFWACVEVGLSLIFFRDMSDQEKVPLMTIYNFLNAVAIVVGTGLGAGILYYGQSSLGSYYYLFAIGSFGRILFAAILHKDFSHQKQLKGM